MRYDEPFTSPHVPELEAVRTWLEKMVAAMKFAELIVAIVAFIARMRDLNAELTKRLAHATRRRPRSETLARVERQLVLPLAGVAAAVACPAVDAGASSGAEPAPAALPKRSPRARHPGRTAFPAHLERVVDDNPVPPEQRVCPRCGTPMNTVGHQTCETLDVVPARIIVRQRRDETVACPKDDTIVSAAPPRAIVEKGKLSDRFILESIADKYLEHLPTERQCTRWERAGVVLAPQTLGRAIAAGIDLLTPLARAIERQTRGPGLLGTDATALPILDPAEHEHVRTGAMWCWTNARWVSFVYSPSADSDSVRRFLGDELARSVQCDATNVTTFIERAGGQRPGCWSHGRRRLVEAARGGDTLALQGLKKIARLFQVERDSARAGETADQRGARRAAHSRRILDDLRAWIDEQRLVIPPKTPLGRALGYLHRQWKRLNLFIDDGRIEATNNRRERELRRLVIGRKNWLFTWLDIGGERTAAILTILATCLAHDINPRAYLHRVAKLLVNGLPEAEQRDLLPDRIADQFPELRLRPDEEDDVPAALGPSP